MRRSQERYMEMMYPHYLPFCKKVWVLKPGDILEKNNKTYIVKQVLKSSSYSVFPKIIIEEYK